MADVLTAGAFTITPATILGYESERESRSIVHEVLSRPDPDITLRAAGLRTGQMELAFTDAAAETNSAAAENALSAGVVCTLASPDRTTVQMSFVLPAGGRLRRRLDAETRSAWIVGFDWQEVPT